MTVKLLSCLTPLACGVLNSLAHQLHDAVLLERP